MNGDAYPSRGMSNPLPTRTYPTCPVSNQANPCAAVPDGRHGSSRDYSSRDDRRDRGGRGDRRDRRRSRSPRRSHRDGREGDVDTYASSRSHRDREREDRYGGSEWDRDRGERGGDRGDRGGDRRGGRDRRDDGRPPRRDRDLFDDRRGDRRGDRDRGGRDRDEDLFAQNRRGRSATPPPKKREPTPDLTNVVPVLERKRRMTQWDIKPPGYENVTAEQAKLSGMFPLPGAPRQQPMDPSKLQAFMNQPGAGSPSAYWLTTSLLVLPRRASPLFFNLQLNGLNVVESTDPCVMCQLSKDGTFALLEFRNPSEATVALAFDGISMEAADDAAANGAAATSGLQIVRPKDYIVPAVVDDTGYEPGVHRQHPPYLSEDQVRELLVAFGELKAFTLVKDQGTDESRGIAFCEYIDPSATDIAVQGLNGMGIGDKSLKVRKASIGITQVAGVEMGVNAMSMLAGTTATNPDESRVLQLLNMVTAEELMDNDDYEEICEDVRDECGKFGNIIALKIPRPSGGSRQSRRRRQNLRPIRHHRIMQEGAAGARWSQVRRQNRGHNFLPRGELRGRSLVRLRLKRNNFPFRRRIDWATAEDAGEIE
ncbi:u2 snrnp auxilliary factor protein [Apiospora phragmitis]|uniref:U2 snrnp auxilliary factor protein n=1 Tax=Apiospora phragmitis TaxID=2905665 RepID=A0ABR1TUR9_9PEZI